MFKRPRTKVVVITGASSGIGRAAAHRFAQRGARIGLLARGVEGLEAARHEVQQYGGEALVLPTDVAHHEQVEAAAAEVDRAFGPVDVWINNAAITTISPVKDTPPEEFARVMEVSYLGVVHGTLAALRRMLPRDAGSIVQVGSALAYRGVPLNAAYCASQHAVKGFCESLWSELKHDGSHVRMTLVRPAGVNTPLWRHSLSRMPQQPRPIGRIYQPELVADALVYAAEHDRRELSVGFDAVKAVYGNKLAPWYADFDLGHTGYARQQQADRPRTREPDNLWQPSPGDPGVHGPFDDLAFSRSAQYWATTHRGLLGLIGGGAVALAASQLLTRNHAGDLKGITTEKRR